MHGARWNGFSKQAPAHIHVQRDTSELVINTAIDFSPGTQGLFFRWRLLKVSGRATTRWFRRGNHQIALATKQPLLHLHKLLN